MFLLPSSILLLISDPVVEMWLIQFNIFFLIGIHSMKAEQQLEGMELQEKETQKD